MGRHLAGSHYHSLWGTLCCDPRHSLGDWVSRVFSSGSFPDTFVSEDGWRQSRHFKMHVPQTLPGPDNHTSLQHYLTPRMKSYQRVNPLRGLGMEHQTLLRHGSFCRSPLLLNLDGLFRYFFLQSWKFKCNIYSKLSQEVLSFLCGKCRAGKPLPVACVCGIPFQPEVIPWGDMCIWKG